MRPLAWRHLGFIPGLLGKLIPSIEDCSKDVGFLHLCDWHHVSKLLLSDLLCLQDKECLEWNYRGKLVRLHIPIMFVIGDIEGHDKLCSSKHGHSVRMGGVTHSCDIRRSKCNDPNDTCNMFKKHEIHDLQQTYRNESLSKMSRQDAADQLQHLGFHPVFLNAYFLLDFGINEHGLHGACAICLLHTFKQKFPDLVVREYMSIFGSSEDTVGKLKINASMSALVKIVNTKATVISPI